MKAVMKTQPKPGIEVKDIPRPIIKHDEVLLKVKAAAICGSDLGIYNYTSAYHTMKVPVVMGHEFSGEIVEKGPDVAGFNLGDRVLSESVKSCGRCTFCKQGMSNLCEESTLFGIHEDGGFAEYVAVPFQLLHHIPENMSYEEAALVEPLSNAVHFVRDMTPFKFGDFVVVQGCGPIGLFSAQLFMIGGAKVLLTGLPLDEVRLSIANKLGIQTFTVGSGSLSEKVMELTHGSGADISFVAVGAPSAVKEATEIIKKRGHVTIVGIFGNEVTLDMTWVVRRELSLAGAYDAKPVNFLQSIDLISSGKVHVKEVLTHRFSLDEAEEAFMVALNRTGGKVEFTP
jgi:L-iditol 2-dehydrogenase